MYKNSKSIGFDKQNVEIIKRINKNIQTDNDMYLSEKEIDLLVINKQL